MKNNANIGHCIFICKPELEEIAKILAEELVAHFQSTPIASAPANHSEFHTPETLADYLQVSLPTIYKWVRLRAIPYQKVGRFVRFNRSEIEQWLSERAVQTVPSNEAKVIIKKRG